MNKISQCALALVTLATCNSAFAENVDYVEKKADYFYSSRYSYMSCDYAEDQAEKFAEAMGGIDAKASCSGGLPHFDFVNVRVKFKAAQPGTTQAGAYTPVKISGRDACDFNEGLLAEIADQFTVQEGDMDSSCWHSQGRFEFTGNVLK